MKCPAAAVVFLSAVAAVQAFAQTEWTKYECNPVLEPGPEGSWWAAVHGHSVLFEKAPGGERVFKMWFTAVETTSSIGFASSKDGIHWDVRSDGPVLPPGKPGSWDYTGPYFPNVLYEPPDDTDPGQYKMWFNGNVGAGVGYAVSADGIKWTKFPENPVFSDVDQPETWDGLPRGETQVPMVVKIAKSDYRMWYTAFLGTGTVGKIGLASSPDGISWQPYAMNPVLQAGPLGTFDYDTIADSAVIFDGATFHVWYDRFQSPDSGTLFGHAESPDGINWTKRPTDAAVLLRGSPGSWDGGEVDQPCVVFDDEKDVYHFWYRGLDTPAGPTHIGYASSPLTRRSVTLPAAGCPTGPVIVLLRHTAPIGPIGSSDRVLSIREIASSPFGSAQVTAGSGGTVKDLPTAPITPVGTFQDGRAVGRAPYCPGGNGSVKFNAPDSTYTVESLGENIGPGGDSFTFAYLRVKGDFTLTAHLQTPGPRPGKSGLMVRQDLSSRSRYSFIYDQWGDQDVAGDPIDMTRWAHRLTHGGKDDQVSLDLGSGDHFDTIRIQRSGDIIRGSFCSGSDLCDEPDFESLEESTWTNPPEAVLVGLAFSSLTTACCKGPLAIAFDRVELELAPGAEVLPAPDPQPVGVEISWEVTRAELEAGLTYEIALKEGSIRFSSGEDGIPIAGDSRVEMTASACNAEFKRGDANSDGAVDLTDAIFVLAFLFQGGEKPGCFDAADVDDSGRLDLTDAIYSLSWQFAGGPEPPGPGPRACGPDVTPDQDFPPCLYPLEKCTR